MNTLKFIDMADKFVESLNIEENVFELTEDTMIGYLVQYYAPYTGGGECIIPAGTPFVPHGPMRGDALYMHIPESFDADALYDMLVVKEKAEMPALAERLAGFSFFITEEQVRNLPLSFVLGSRERLLEIFHLCRTRHLRR